MKDKYKKPKATRVAKLSKPVAAAVQKIIRKDIEDKYQTVTLDDPYLAAYNLQLASTLGSLTSGRPVIGARYGLLPDIAQGTGLSTRDGDSLRVKSMSADFTFSINPDYTQAFRIQCRLMCLVERSVKQYSQMSVNATELFTIGDGTVSTPVGLPIERNYRINTKKYQVLSDKHFLLEKSAGDIPKNGNGYLGTMSEIPTHLTHQLRVKVPCPSVLKYPTGTGAPENAYPTNFAPFWCMTWSMANIDNSGAATAWQADLVQTQFVSHLVFEDA